MRVQGTIQQPKQAEKMFAGKRVPFPGAPVSSCVWVHPCGDRPVSSGVAFEGQRGSPQPCAFTVAGYFGTFRTLCQPVDEVGVPQAHCKLTPHGSSASLHGSKVPLDGSCVSLDGSNKPLDGSNGSFDGSSGTLQGSSEILDGSSEAFDGSSGTLDGSSVSFDGSNGTLQGSSVSLDGSSGTLDRSSEAFDGSSAPLQGSSAAFDGSNASFQGWSRPAQRGCWRQASHFFAFFHAFGALAATFGPKNHVRRP